MDSEGTWFRFKSFRDYVEALRAEPPATNCALLVGHSMLRLQTMDDLEKPASRREISLMRNMVDEALDAGAIGFSTGLYYEPARAAPTEEVIEVCRPLAAGKGIYCTHTRDDGERVVDTLAAIYFSMDEQDVQRILGFEHTMIGSDGLPHDAAPHPRLWGTFPRVLGHYARDLGLFSLESAVHKMTGLTANTFGLADRGVLKQGFAADIVVFDENEIDETASFAKPIQRAKGIDTVIVNGAVVWREGKPTGRRPGRGLACTA